MYLNEEKSISIKVYLFDANHTPGYLINQQMEILGSVLILF